MFWFVASIQFVGFLPLWSSLSLLNCYISDCYSSGLKGGSPLGEEFVLWVQSDCILLSYQTDHHTLEGTEQGRDAAECVCVWVAVYGCVRTCLWVAVCGWVFVVC